jgi:hypothetical protein
MIKLSAVDPAGHPQEQELQGLGTQGAIVALSNRRMGQRRGGNKARSHLAFRRLTFAQDDFTWRQRIQPPHKRAKQTSGPLVLITDRVRRASKLVSASTRAATRGDDSTTLRYSLPPPGFDGACSGFSWFARLSMAGLLSPPPCRLPWYVGLLGFI